MKLLLIAYNEAIDDEVMELLERARVEGYTKWTKVMGRGRSSGPHMLNEVWPSGNNVLVIAVQDEQARVVMEEIRRQRETVRTLGLKAFALPLDEVT